MVTATDFLLDESGDLVTGANDLVTGASDVQHIEHLVQAFAGFYRESPLCGAGIGQYYRSSGTAPEVQRAVAVQLAADNYQVNEVQVSLSVTGEMKVSVDAKRIR